MSKLLLAGHRRITDRKAVEISLRESELRFREMADLVPTIICEIDNDMRFQYFNEAGLKAFGYTQKDLKRGLHVKDIVVRQDQHKAFQRAGSILKGQRIGSAEYRMRTKRGQERIFMANAAPMVRNGKLAGLRASMVDITERKAVEVSLRQSEEQLRAIFQSLHNSILSLYDCDGLVTFIVAPPALCKRYGLELSSMVGQDPGQLVSPKDRRQRLVQIHDTFRTGRTNHYQCRARMPKGMFDLDVTLSPMRSQDGKIVSVVGFLRDVTAEVQAANDARQAHLRLESAREEERRRLAGELHDSVGQGLIALQLSAKNTLTHGRAHMTDKQISGLAQIANRCGSLIREVRAICHGLYPPTLESLGLAASLRQLVMEPHGDLDVRLKLEVHDEALELKSDEAIALFRIAQEAMSNAIRHSKATTLGINLARRDGRLILRISDNGIGLDVDKSAAGIGLASMRQRMLALDGDLKITSRPGRTVVEASLAQGSQ